MRKDRFTTLRVIDRTARQVSADRNAHYGRARKIVVRAPPNQRQFVAKLLHRRPDVIEELYLNDGLHAACRHADGATDDIGFRQRRVKNAVRAEVALQTRSQLEDST